MWNLSLLSLLGIVFAVGCLPLPGLEKQGGSSQKLAETGMNPHADSLLKLAQQASCNACHTGAGGRVPFADGTLSKAYSGMLQVISINAPSESRLLIKSQDNHFGGSAKVLASSEWSALITQFADYEVHKASTGGSGVGAGTGVGTGVGTGTPEVLSAPQVITTPQELNSTSNNNANFTYNLTVKGLAQTTSVTARLVVRGMDSNATPNYARIGNLLITNNSNIAVKVEGVRIFLSSSTNVSPTADYDPARGSLFLKVNATVAPNGGTFIEVRNSLFFNSPKKFVSIGFQKLEVASAGSGNEPCAGAGLAAFTAFYNQVAAKCTNCHAGGQGGYVFNNNPTTSCQSSVSRANTANPGQSEVLLKARINPGAAHQGGKPMNATEEALFMDWVRTFD